MGNIQKAFELELEKTPQHILHQLIEKKLRMAGVDPEPALVERILSHALNNDSSSFQWDDGKSDELSIALSISDEDVKEAENMFSKLMESLPDIIEKVSDSTAESILNTLKHEWREEYSLQQADLTRFTRNLEKRWGKPLGMLRMLLTISREFGEEVAKLRPPRESHLNDVLFRLHVRACQVTAEIITLLENGYADGAMARWRTLHEISIVMILINEHGEQLAERYIEHRVVEAKHGKDQYQLCYEQLGYQPLTRRTCDEIEREFNAAISKYGKEFGGPYGWAAGYVSKGQRGIGLKEIEAAAGRSAMASHYKLASHNVHAGPHALFFRLGLMGESGFLAGASNAGLTEPGQNTATSLTVVSVLLANDYVDLDIIIMMKVIQQLRNEIPMAFYRAEETLRNDHVRFTKGRRKLRSQRLE